MVERRGIGRHWRRKEEIDIEMQEGEVAVPKGEQLQVGGLLAEEVK